MKKNLLLHFRPRRIPREALRFRLTWGLGGMAALMVILQLLTGLLLAFFYEPLPVQAYISVQHIQHSVFLGGLVRNLHHWTGHGLIIVIFLHLLRIFVHGAFYPPRHGNWLVGLGLAALIFTANFSGYLLPWDQLSYWAVTIATSMLSYIPLIGIPLQKTLRGGEEVGAATLQIFYAIHTSLVPTAIFLLLAYHFWYIRRAGGVLIPDRSNQQLSNTAQPQYVSLDNLLIKECAFASMVICGLLLFSMLIHAPLGAMANPALTPASVKAPWYFLGLQELLLHIPPLAAVCFLPLCIGIFLIFLPFIGKRKEKPGHVIKILFFSGFILVLSLTITGIWFRGPAMIWVWPW